MSVETKEQITKIILDGEKEYKEALSEIREETKAFREEVEQLNAALEKEAKLLKSLR